MLNQNTIRAREENIRYLIPSRHLFTSIPTLKDYRKRSLFKADIHTGATFSDLSLTSVTITSMIFASEKIQRPGH